MASLTPGMSVGEGGRFRLEHKLGEGGMADIWSAIDLQQDPASGAAQVAVKVLKADFLTQTAGNMSTSTSELVDQLSKRFKREAGLLSRLEHRNLARFITSGELDTSGSPFIVMEFIEGETLDGEIWDAAKAHGLIQTKFEGSQPYERMMDPDDIRKIVSETPVMRLSDIFDIAEQVLSGLAYLHNPKGGDGGVGITHRDIKPSNVMIKRDRHGNILQVKIIDLGIAGVASEVREEFGAVTQFTKMGSVLGTPTFMPMEQFKNTSQAGPSADVYAMGVTLFEMITGLEPYSGKGSYEVMGALCNANALDPGKFVRNVPPDLRAVVMKATEREPELRYPSGHEMWGALIRARNNVLDAAMGAFASNATLSSQPTVESDRPPPPPKPVRPASRASRQATVVRRSRMMPPKRPSNSARHMVPIALASLFVGIAITFFVLRPDTWKPEMVPEGRGATNPETVAPPTKTTKVPRDPTPVRTTRPLAEAGDTPAPERPDSAESIFQLGMRFYNARRYDLALERFETAQKLAPSDPEINRMIRDCKRRLGR
ncbi:protein kinase [Candidatus Uhrbacteria bacterium]|nr:protein kinase [Candidatus Uhrbacteria bacterium]MBD3284170.1 protein kinase [Candidatus Uhrbacteria bacterium]